MPPSSPRRLRIAQLVLPVLPVPPPAYGGAELVVSLLTEELVRRGHDVTLFASADSVTAGQLRPIVAQALWRNTAAVDMHPYVMAAVDEVYCREAEFDVIHNHAGFFALPATRGARQARTLTTMHGRIDTPDQMHGLSHFRDASLVAISEAQRRTAPAAGWLATIHHGLDVRGTPFAARSEGYLAYLGRVAPEKGLDVAVRVAVRAGLPLRVAARLPLAAAASPDARREWEYYKQIVQPLLHAPGVEYVGELGGADKQRFLAGASALLFPIRWPEPFGLVMIEAFAAGTPVLAFGAGSVPEVVDDGLTGFVVQDEDAMVAAIGRIGQLDRGAVRQTAERRYSVAVMVDAYEQAYERLLAQASGSGGTACP